MSFPDVSGANGSGASREEALHMAEDALVAALGAHYRLRRDIPIPTTVEAGQEAVALRPLVAAKVALAELNEVRDQMRLRLVIRRVDVASRFYAMLDRRGGYGVELREPTAELLNAKCQLFLPFILPSMRATRSVVPSSL